MFRTLYLKLVSSVAEDANITRQVHLTFEVVGPACQNITRNHHIRGQKKIAFSYSDPGGTLKKIKQRKTLLWNKRQNSLAFAKSKLRTLQSIIYLPEGKNILEQAAPF